MSVVALDIPSGLSDAWNSGDAVVRADLCVCFGYAKQCLYRQQARVLCGRVVVCDIGFPPEAQDLVKKRAGETGGGGAFLLEAGDLSNLVPDVPPDVYKYRRGVVSIFAGSAGYTGAAKLCAVSASRSMAGMVRLFVDKKILALFADLPAGIVLGAARMPAGRSDVLLVGPGWGRSGRRLRALRRFLRDHGLGRGPRGLVLDADALHLLARLGPSPKKPAVPLVLTPHHGELAALAGVDIGEMLADPDGYARKVAERYGAIVVLKGGPTWIVCPAGDRYVVDEVNPALAVAGSGDVFAGMLAAQLALGLALTEEPAHKAVCCAALAHVCLAQNGLWPDAAMLCDEIPALWSRYRSPRRLFTGYN